jgi:hypothetical protein
MMKIVHKEFHAIGCNVDIDSGAIFTVKNAKLKHSIKILRFSNLKHLKIFIKGTDLRCVSGTVVQFFRLKNEYFT